jgi:hypothetical protein
LGKRASYSFIFITIVLAINACSKAHQTVAAISPADVTGKWFKHAITRKYFTDNTLDTSTAIANYTPEDYFVFAPDKKLTDHSSDSAAVTEGYYSYDATNKLMTFTFFAIPVTTLIVKTLTKDDFILFSEDSISSSGHMYKNSIEIDLVR